MAPKSEKSLITGEEFPPGMIGRTNYPNTPEGYAALVKTIRLDTLFRERRRVEENARREGGDFGIELENAFDALRTIEGLEYPADDVETAGDMIDRARINGFTDVELIPDKLDATVEALATYAQELTIQTQNLDWTSKTIRNGVEPSDD